MLLGLLAIAAILFGVPIIAYCVLTLNAPETSAQRRKRYAKRDAARRADRAASYAARRAARA